MSTRTQINCLGCGKIIKIPTIGLIEVKVVCLGCVHKYEMVDGKIRKKKVPEWTEELDNN